MGRANGTGRWQSRGYAIRAVVKRNQDITLPDGQEMAAGRRTTHDGSDGLDWVRESLGNESRAADLPQ